MKLYWAAAALSAGTIATIAATCDTPQADLPLRRLTLYSTGVGYYERAGVVARGTAAEIPLEAGQLDDALKTAVILSDGVVASIEYDPPVPSEAARAEAGLSEDDSEADLAGYVYALRGVGVAVEARDGDPLEGRVAGVDASGEQKAILIFGPGGLARIALEDVRAIRPKDSSTERAWERALAASSTRPQRAALRVRAGEDGGKIAVGYTTEAPVWRTTYRLVVAKDDARIQGFALVHNNSDEDWRELAVTLVSGRPQSFLFPLAVPRYSRRELVEPEDGLEVAPQLMTAEIRGHLTGSAIGDAIGIGGLGTIGYGAGGGALGGRASRDLTISDESLLAEGPGAIEPAAVSEAGDLFLYRVMRPVTLPARKSALLPIVDSKITAERVTVIGEAEQPLHGVRIVNSTALTLEAGTLAIYTDAAFAGEAQLQRTKPKEARVVTHGEDLDVEATIARKIERGPATSVHRIGPHAFVERRDQQTYRLQATSRSDRARVLLVPLAGEGYRIDEGAEEDVRSPGQPRYGRLALEPRAKIDVIIRESNHARQPFDPFDVEELEELLASGELEPKSRTTLLAAREAVLRAVAADERAGDARSRLQQAEADVVRLRESVAAAGKGATSPALEALASKLVRVEDRLEQLRAEVRSAQKAGEAAREQALGALDTGK